MTVQQILVDALAHHQAGRLSEAEGLYRQILAQQPDQPDALHLLGMVRHETGDSTGARELIRHAIARVPTAAEFHSNLGLVLAALEELDAAAAAYSTALRLKPDSTDAHYGLGIVLFRQGKFDPAIHAYERALAFDPNFADTHNNLGNALRAKGQLLQAISHYERAAALKPDDADVLSNLGIALYWAGQLQRSIGVLRQSLAINPNLVQALMNLGTALTDQGLLLQAMDCYRKALKLAPNRPDFHSNLIATMNFAADSTLSSIRDETRRWWDRHGAPRAATIRPHVNIPDPDRRLRIGYISADFCDHPCSFFFSSLLRHHDRKNVEVTLYANVSRPDEISARLRGYASNWRDISETPEEQIADLIRNDGIDILVDAMLHSSGNSLPVLARKPAPVQVTWLGYTGSTGLKTIDYRLTDPYLDPPGVNDDFYSEFSVRLLNCFWCFDPLGTQPHVGAAPHKTCGHITFGCMNNFCKVNDDTIALWAQILAEVPTSRMILLSPEGRHRDHTLQQFGDAASRVEFVSRQPRNEYLRTYDRIDLILDTFPYNGHTTNFDALWMGVPVVTLVGQPAFSRAGLSLLMNLGLPEFVARRREEYVNLAIGFATDRRRIVELRGAALRKRMEESALMDGHRFARDIESVYRTMWRRWCNKESAGPWPA